MFEFFCMCGNPAQHILHCFQLHLVETPWANPHCAMDIVLVSDLFIHIIFTN